MAIPTFLSGQAVVIIRTPNGYALGPRLDCMACECVVFETWDALTYYLGANFVTQPA
jgi:hypothetical protein